MNIQVRADAVAGAVAVIEPPLLVHSVSMVSPSFEYKLTHP